jgi:hypothetical protein
MYGFYSSFTDVVLYVSSDVWFLCIVYWCCFIQHKLTEISYNTPSVFTCSPPTIAIRYEGICTFCSEPLCIYLLSQSPPTIAIRYKGNGTFCSVLLCIYLLSKSSPTIKSWSQRSRE